MSHIAVTPPSAAEYDPFYARYVARVPEMNDAVRTLAEQRHRLADLVA